MHTLKKFIGLIEIIMKNVLISGYVSTISTAGATDGTNVAITITISDKVGESKRGTAMNI